MSVAKIVEVSATSPNGFEDAIEEGIRKAAETLQNIRGAWVSEQKVRVEGGKITQYRVDLKISFVLND